VAKHHEACLSSGSAPHSGQRRLAVATDRFKLRASSKRRWRPFFTETTPCPTQRQHPQDSELTEVTTDHQSWTV
jgi:hypothetical protein